MIIIFVKFTTVTETCAGDVRYKNIFGKKISAYIINLIKSQHTT